MVVVPNHIMVVRGGGGSVVNFLVLTYSFWLKSPTLLCSHCSQKLSDSVWLVGVVDHFQFFLILVDVVGHFQFFLVLCEPFVTQKINLSPSKSPHTPNTMKEL